MLNWGKEKKSTATPKQATQEPETSQSEASESGLRNYGRSQSLHPSSAPPAPRANSLSQLLLTQGQVSEAQLKAAKEKQKKSGAFLGEILIDEGVLDEKSFLSFLAKHCKIPHLSLLDYLIDTDILDLVPKDICLKYRLLPIDKLGRNLTLAMVNPLNTEALEKVRALCPELRIKPILCAHNHFETVTQRLFSGEAKSGPVELSASSLGLQLPPVASESQAPQPKEQESLAETIMEESPVAALDMPSETQEEVLGAVAEEEIPDAIELPEEETQTLSEESDQSADLDGDELIDEVFHPENPQEAEESTPEETGESSLLMQEMASVMMDSMRDTYAMLARRMELFQKLDPEDVAKLFSKGITKEYPADTLIFEKGDQSNELYVILGGSVSIFDGDQVIASLQRGDMFGEMALVSNEPRSASARTTTSSSLLTLSMDIFHHVMPPEVSVQVLSNIVITLSARLRQANEALAKD